jgi:hypothetical protein
MAQREVDGVGGVTFIFAVEFNEVEFSSLGNHHKLITVTACSEYPSGTKAYFQKYCPLNEP